jgi:pilus assembly protein Flp/PilA
VVLVGTRAGIPIPALFCESVNNRGEVGMNNLFLKLLVKVQNLLARDDGQDLVEYALLISLIALAAISGVKHVATALTGVFSTISTSLA